MSQRSNAFQKAIHFIHDQLKDTDTKVTESALLPELNIEPPVFREIDVLIEREIEGKIFRMAIECRDRSQKDEIGWIDSLIGKYIRLPIDKVIAVSSAGFSKQAILKAKDHRIELRTIVEICKINWDIEFIKIGMVDVQMNFNIQRVTAETPGSTDITMLPGLTVVCDGIEGTFDELFTALMENYWSDFFKYFQSSRAAVYKQKSDVSKSVIIEHRKPVFRMQVIIENTPKEITALKFFIIGIPTVSDLETKHFQYLDSVLSRAEMKIDDKKSFTLYTSQAKPNDKLILSVDKKKKPRKDSKI